MKKIWLNWWDFKQIDWNWIWFNQFCLDNWFGFQEFGPKLQLKYDMNFGNLAQGWLHHLCLNKSEAAQKKRLGKWTSRWMGRNREDFILFYTDIIA